MPLGATRLSTDSLPVMSVFYHSRVVRPAVAANRDSRCLSTSGEISTLPDASRHLVSKNLRNHV